MFLYITSDKIGSETGGGVVTKNELLSLRKMGDVIVLNPTPETDVFATERHILNELPKIDISKIKLAHFYSSTYPETVKYLKSKGIKISYTVAAHDNIESKKEFEILGIPYEFPHMTVPELFEKHNSSYKNADVVICPSSHSKIVMERIGCKNINVIPHGCEPLPSKPLPKRFNVGYLGQIGPDKGVKYLLEAWALLNYKDCNLNLAGAQTPWLLGMIRSLGKGNFNIMGYVKNIEDFYNACSIYVQPSVTEGFGIEVLEAMSAGRPVVVSDGAGATDVVGGCGFVVPSRNIMALAEAIDKFKNNKELQLKTACVCQENASKYLWEKIKDMYVSVWESVLN
jgi:glycosyltransferase involved in cell wall biosynthesis